MYGKIGKLLSESALPKKYGDSYIDTLAAYIQRRFPGIKGFNRRGLYRMKLFYQTYVGKNEVEKLLTKISWTCHLRILSACKSDEEREFYICLAMKEHYSVRQLTRQIDSCYFERYMLSKSKIPPEKCPSDSNPFLDEYVVDFLNLPDVFHESDVRKAIVKAMGDFILELGKELTFVGEEYRIQVDEEDYKIDFLLYHRSLRCFVAIELKTGKFKPEYISKMDFYLEALDRQVKLPIENPSVGLILWTSKSDKVVEYAMSRTLSPLTVAQYQTQLSNKEVLCQKLCELSDLKNEDDETEEGQEKEEKANDE